MRIAAVIVAIGAGTLLLVPASAQQGEGQSSKQEIRHSADKIQALRRERIATLKEMVEIETALHQKGIATPEAVLEARVLVCEAELDASEKESDRITLLKSLVQVLKEHEQLARVRKQSAEGTEAAILKVKARRLEAEIRLEQAQSQRQAKNAEPEQERVVVSNPQAKDVVVAEQFACQINSRRHIDVRSLQSGYLEEIQVKEGQAVKQGDVMFKIAPLLYKAKLDAELAEVELATLNLKSTEKLLQSKVVSENEVALLRAKQASAQAKAKLAQTELGLTMVRAPFDGMIDRLREQQGSLVTEREVLTTLSDNSVMWAYFNVPQTYYLAYMSNPGEYQEAAVDLVLADGHRFTQSGKLAAVEAQFDTATGTIPFRADFPNPEGVLRHGMAGTLSIRRTLKSAIVIPQRATFEVRGKRYVYVVDKEDVAHERELVIQSEVGDDLVIKQGLASNDRIVLGGVRQIRARQKLQYEFRKP